MEVEKDQGSLTDIDRENIYWMTLALRLPRGGVRSAFLTEAACRQRLHEVRWPDGVTCGKCSSHDIVSISTRSVFQFQICREHFSLTSGTIMHRSHLPSTMWFAGAELLIRTRAFPSMHRDVINRRMADYLGVQYEAGWRMKKKLVTDLSIGGAGLMRDAVCVNSLRPPRDLELGSAAHLRWLGEQRSPPERDLNSPDFESIKNLQR